MLSFLFNTSKLILYSIYIKKKYDYYKDITDKDLNIIHKYINNCGCITIKCIQWLVPLLEKENINNKILKTLSNVYEHNDIHNIRYTECVYLKHFKENIYNKYEIIEVIGSGSIGQVYKIRCKK